MALRSATRRYPDLISFLKEYKSTLRVGAVVLPPDPNSEEIAPEIKLDFIFPVLGRVGPVDAQVVNRMPDGSVALRIPDVPKELKDACKQLLEMGDQIKDWLLSSGQVSPKGGDPAEAQRLKAESTQLREELAQAQAQILKLQEDLQKLESQLTASASTLESTRAEQVIALAAAKPPPPSQERGLPVPDVSRLSPWRSGKMGDRSLRDAMMALAIAKTTGLLSIEQPSGLRRWGYWWKGGVVAWRSEPVQESEVLGILLLRAQQITKDQLQTSLEMMEKNNSRQGDALIEMGILAFPSLVLLLQKQAEFVLQAVIKEKEGTWTFHALTELPEKFVAPPVRVAQVLYKSMRQSTKEMPAEALAGYLRPLLDRYVYLVDNADKTLEEMKMSADEQAFVKIIASTSYRTRELFAVSSLSRSATASMVWLLNELSLLEFRTAESDARNQARVGISFEDRRRRMIKGTLFDRLEVHWICTKNEIEASWKRFQVEFSPERLTQFSATQRADLASMVALGKEAYEKLMDDRFRREYRVSIMDKTLVETSAEMLARKGDMSIVKGLINESIDCYGKAHDLMPNVTEYRDGLNRALSMRT